MQDSRTITENCFPTDDNGHIYVLKIVNSECYIKVLYYNALAAFCIISKWKTKVCS